MTVAQDESRGRVKGETRLGEIAAGGRGGTLSLHPSIHLVLILLGHEQHQSFELLA